MKKLLRVFLILTVLAAIVIALAFWFGIGGQWSPFTASLHPKDKKKQIKEKQKTSKKKLSSKREKVSLRMRFIDNELRIDNWRCPDEKSLKKVIAKIKDKYSKKEVTIEYHATDDDPYLVSSKAEKMLRQGGFFIKVYEQNKANAHEE